jgi:arginyl-tRNA synthetase
VSQSFDTHLEIDVEKATSNTSTNSLYYVQYAHARINQLIEKHKYENPKKFNLLTLDSEIELMCNINDFKPLLECCAKNYQVHRLITYLTNLAKNYHSYYSNTQIIDKSNPVISSQRYYLSVAVKQIIKNGLALLDIKASEKM